MTQPTLMVNITLLPSSTTTEDPLARFIRDSEPYDYKGAILYVFGLLIMYGISIFLLIISLIRKARGEFEVIDYMRDLEEMRRETRRKNRSSCERSKIGSLKSLAGLGTSKQNVTDSLPSITEAFRQYSRPLLLGASTSERHTSIRPLVNIENPPGNGAYRPRRSSIAIPGMARLAAPVNLSVRRKSDGMVFGPKSPILPEKRPDFLKELLKERNEPGESSAMIQSPSTLEVTPSCSYGTIDEEKVDRRPPVHISLPAPVNSPEFPGRLILYDPMEDRERYRLRPKHERALGLPLYDPNSRRPSAHAHEAYTTAKIDLARQEIRRNSAFARFAFNYSSIEEDPEIDSRSVSPAAQFEPVDDLVIPVDVDEETSDSSTSDSDQLLPAITKVWVPGVPKDPIALHLE